LKKGSSGVENKGVSKTTRFEVPKGEELAHHSYCSRTSMSTLETTRFIRLRLPLLIANMVFALALNFPETLELFLIVSSDECARKGDTTLEYSPSHSGSFAQARAAYVFCRTRTRKHPHPVRKGVR